MARKTARKELYRAKLAKEARPGAVGSVLTQAQLDKRTRRARRAKAARPSYTVAKVGDTYTGLDEKYGLPPGSTAQANKTQKPKAGAAVNIPPMVGVGAGAGIGEEIVDWWQGATPWDESAGETFYSYYSPEPGGVGTPERFVETIAPIGQWIKNAVTGVVEWIEGKEEGGGGKAQPSLAYQPPPPDADIAQKLRDLEFYGGILPEQRLAFEQEFGVTPKTEYGPAPGPQVGFDFQGEGSSDLYKALAEQTVAVYEQEEVYRWNKYGSGLLGLHLYEDQGKLDAIEELGFEPWVKPFTVNYLNQFPGTSVSVNEAGELTGTIDWSFVDDETIQRLSDLGFIEAGGAGTTAGAGIGTRTRAGGGSTGSARYRSSGYAPRGNQLYSRGTQLALVSWSI